MPEYMLKIAKKSCTVEPETWDGMIAHWRESGGCLSWNYPFVLPGWLKTWWNNFGSSAALDLLSVRQEGRTIGIAPLQRTNDTVMFLGNEDVCDSLDFVIAPGSSDAFYETLIDYLKREGVRRMELVPVRPDSSVISSLLPTAAKAGCRTAVNKSDVSFEMALPHSWDAYLKNLTGKQRHEIRRKLRRLHAAGDVTYRQVEDAFEIKQAMNSFLALFKSNRTEKAGFMSTPMAAFFMDLAGMLAEARILKLFFLYLDGKAVAATMCFDYRSTMYLYNNGYDKEFSSLSVGLLCKVHSIKESIHLRKTTYDFLKGAEVYKKRLGGRPLPLYRCVIELT